MARSRKQLLDAFKPPLKEHGFKKTDRTWHRELSEVVCVLNVQTSQWSELYYFNVGIWIKALETPIRPGFPGSRLGRRLPLESDNFKRCSLLADFENDVADVATRINELRDIIVPDALAWFSAHETREKIRHRLEDPGNSEIPVPLIVRRYFNLPLPE